MQGLSHWQDPATSSSIILTTVTDVVGFFLFRDCDNVMNNVANLAKPNKQESRLIEKRLSCYQFKYR